MNETLARNIFIRPVHRLRGERLWEHLEEVRGAQSLNRDAVREFQQEKLRALIAGAARTQPYYRRLVEELWAGSVPEDVLADFHRVPFQTKEIVRALHDPVKGARGTGKLDCRSTSGSTGMPLRFFKDRYATGYMEAVQLCAYGWFGIGAGAPQGRFWGMPQGVKGRFVAGLKDLLKNRIRFSAFDLSPAAKDAFCRRLDSFRPSYFYGYPSLILEFGRHVKKHGVDLSRVPLKLVIGTGEFVYPEEKREIEEIFGVPYVSEYGCTETGVIAFDCPRGGMHVMIPNIYLEVLKEDRPVLDQEGDICITELNSLHAPFVRYKIGDRGKLLSRPCPCGLHWPLLEVLAGRRDDYVITPEGEKIYDAIFAYTLKDGVAYFKAVQESPSSVVVYLVPDAGFDDARSQKYLAKLQERLGGSVRVRFELVRSIERTKAGKFRYFERRF